MWEVDWTTRQPGNANRVWARNPSAHIRRAREWHWVSAGYLSQAGINTPVYRKDSWEIDWEKRDGKRVWGRNPMSKMPSAREWHWIDHSTLDVAGVRWKPKTERTGRYIDGTGYVVLSRFAMSVEDVAIAHQFALFRGQRKTFVKEHQLAAVKKYGYKPEVVRHVNGIKTDNRPENILAGTIQENTADHVTARTAAMFWRDKYYALVNRLAEILTPDLAATEREETTHGGPACA